VTSYVRGQLTHIPAGTREDSADLFLRLFVPWWDKMQFNEVFAQAIVHDEWVAGMLDLRANGIVFDVKCTYNLLPRHFIQVAAYSDLSADEPMALIHLSKRFKEPRIVDVPDSAREDWRTTRKFWELTRR
jgi:hypothetical protein